MKSIRFVLFGLFVTLMGIITVSKAEDIDIYSGLGGAAGMPNVLIVFDNAANFSSNAAGSTCIIDGVATALSGTVGGIEQCAFYNVISALPTDSSGNALINIGMMVYNANNIRDINESNCGGGDGGCLVQPLIPMDAAHKAPLLAWIKTWRTSGGAGTGYIKSVGEATAATMQEAWAYYAGSTGLSGRSYTGIKPAAGCQQNFVIFIGNSFSSSGSPGDGGSASPAAALASAPGVTTKQKEIITTTHVTSCGTYTFPTSAHEGKGFYADEWARYMRQADIYSTIEGTQKITTYTIGLLGSSCQAEYAATLTSMANVGGGKYFATTDYVSITQALLKILNEVQAVNSVFSSSSLPVSVNAQGTYLNQIYMGMFRPDSSGQPRWLGNLKQYQFNYDASTGNLTLGDKNGNSAINAAGTGFISPDAVSFWTSKNLLAEPDLGGGFWRNLPLPNGAGAGYDSPDGELVEKGGAAQVLRLANLVNNYTATPATSTNPRKLYTYCPSGTCTAQLSHSYNAFDSTNARITDALLGTGARTITSITSAATTTATNAVAGATVLAVNVSISSFAKSGSTVTATVSSATDLAHIASAGLITISTGTAKYDCTPCTVTATPTATTFTYTKSGGGGGAATVPYIATVPTTNTTSTNVDISKVAHGLAVGQKVTFSTCSVLTGLNGQVTNITAATANTFTVSAPSALFGSDSACHYTPNTATVTSAEHGFPNGEKVTIAGASPSDYNGNEWVITVTGTNTFTYQYTAAAPLSTFTGSATASSTTTTRTNLTQWVRGSDNNGDESGPGGTINIRPSVHGDVLHSRPTVINYGGTTGVVVFYGANDGVFRAINGNQTNPTGSILTAPGSELWGFIPSEFYGKLRRLHDNSPLLSLPTTLPGIIPTPKTKDYFVDGSTGTYQLLNADGTTNTAYLYLAMRRGGRFLYALNVSAPTNPQYLWRISNTDTDFAELGQTWSQPKVANVKGYANPVLIFGAGYDTAEDSEPPIANTMGRGIFIVDAITGSMVWSATYGTSSACSGATCSVSGMNYSIPADIALVDRDNDGKVDRLYAADTGGNVWRVDLQRTTAGITPEFWRVNKVAALGCATGACAAGTTPRKFFYPADVVPTNSYDAVLVGSGDREHPLYSNLSSNKSYSISNRFYMLKDITGNDGSNLTTITHSNLFDATSTVYDGTLGGFYIVLGTGEKVVNAPTTVAGYTYFGTNQPTAPSANSCTANLGIARGYSIKPLTGAYSSTEFDGGGLPPSPVSGLVNITVIVNGVLTTRLVPFLIGGGGGADCVGPDCSSSLGSIKPPINVKTSRHRAYWYKN